MCGTPQWSIRISTGCRRCGKTIVSVATVSLCPQKAGIAARQTTITKIHNGKHGHPVSVTAFRRGDLRMNGPPVCHFIPASISFWSVVGNREVIAELSFLEGESSLVER